MVQIIESITALPVIVLAIMVISLVPGTMIIAYPITLALISWPQIAKVVRAKVIEEKTKAYVGAARTTGTTHGRIIFSHLFPNLLADIIASMTLTFASVAIIEAGLSFLDFGFPTTIPTIGTLISPINIPGDGGVMMMPGGSLMILLRHYPQMWLPPVVILVVITFSLNIVGNFITKLGSPDH